MKSILQSIKPKWCALILNGEKTIEVRKTAPKDWMDYLSGKTKVKPEPRTVYIYCTKDREILTDNGYGKFYVTDDDETKSSIKLFGYSLNGKVIAKYTLRKVEEIKYLLTYGYMPMSTRYSDEPFWKRTCLSLKEVLGYGKGKNLYGWHISDLEIFDKPRELGEFGLTKAPQSWCYVEAIE